MPAPVGNSAEPIGLGDVIDGNAGDGSQSLLVDPAAVWSSGTWLERGFWYSEQEVVIFVRDIAPRNTVLALDGSNPPAVPGLGGRFGPGNTLQIRTRHPAALANAKITFGRFLFRDQANRDHNAEVTFFGAGREEQSGRIQSIVPNALGIPDGSFIVDPKQNRQATTIGYFLNNLSAGNDAFDFSNVQVFNYTSEVNTVEVNYLIKQRMSRDALALQPNGQWVRQGSPTTTKEFLAGVRWLSLDEWLNWDASADPVSNGRAGFMRIRTNNDLVGFQLGAAMGYKANRFSMNFRGKAGPYVNFARMNRDFEVRDALVGQPANVVNEARTRVREESIAFVGEFQAIAKYHLNPNFSLRIGYQMLYVDSVAVAPFQLTFDPCYNVVGLSAGAFYQGGSVGVEGYW